MIYPGSFIWRRMPNKWLSARSTIVGFGISCVIIVLMTVVMLRDVGFRSQNQAIQVLLAFGGATVALSVFFLWGACGSIG
jgi:hypothetical protein